MKTYLYLIPIAILLYSCNASNVEVSPPKKYNNLVGDIPVQADIDNPNFQLCDSTKVIHQRTALRYLGGNEAIEKTYMDKFNPQSSYTQFTGYVVIRFIMNCNNETGRFRVQSLADDFSLQKCPSGMQEELLTIAKNLNAWQHAPTKDTKLDYTKYINIKITNGKVVEILH